MVDLDMQVDDDRRGDKMTLNTDEVRRVVRDENRGLTEGITGVMTATREMTHAINELTSQSRVNDEKFANLHSQIRHVGTEADANNRALLRLTTEVIPHIEQQVAVNGFSVGAFWKSAAIVLTPIGLMATYLYKTIEGRDNHIVALVAELHTLVLAL